jgi:acyl-CoA oxidase
VIDGKPCGIQLFIVPIRNPVSGEPMPGVTVGDIGPKFGRNGNDNGYISFDKVRIPRDNMLSKWAQVDREGNFRAPMSPAVAYFSTILERVGSVAGACSFVTYGLTIATRFGAVRRQGSTTVPEPQIIDYPIHQTRYFFFVTGSFWSLFTERQKLCWS